MIVQYVWYDGDATSGLSLRYKAFRAVASVVIPFLHTVPLEYGTCARLITVPQHEPTNGSANGRSAMPSTSTACLRRTPDMASSCLSATLQCTHLSSGGGCPPLLRFLCFQLRGGRLDQHLVYQVVPVEVLHAGDLWRHRLGHVVPWRQLGVGLGVHRVLVHARLHLVECLEQRLDRVAQVARALQVSAKIEVTRQLEHTSPPSMSKRRGPAEQPCCRCCIVLLLCGAPAKRLQLEKIW